MHTSSITKAGELLKQAFGEEASFREGQQEAIQSLLIRGARRLEVQKTGWGKSVVYWIVTKLLRDEGGGCTVVVSPLLSLMRNQILLARKFGLRAETINSTNRDDWDAVVARIRNQEIDIVYISPERLSNPDFRNTVLPFLENTMGMLVIDEAHCISDWGHDFRPDYRRILQTIERLPNHVSILATTATANDRVIDDIKTLLGDGLVVSRGSLMRESLKLTVFSLKDQARRLAWLAKYVPRLSGTGIIYTLTINDAERVAKWLKQHNVNVHAYHSKLEPEKREQLENAFLQDKVKALVATTALGMGYDKDNVGFVVHFQFPGSIIQYYQQIGRAGRNLAVAHCVLLVGEEDEEISQYFIDSAFPDALTCHLVTLALKNGAGTMADIARQTNRLNSQIEKVLSLMDVEGAVVKNGRFVLVNENWKFDRERAERITSQRIAELDQMREYIGHKGCRMLFLAHALDDKSQEPCGKCDNCKPHALISLPVEMVRGAITFLQLDNQIIKPRKNFPFRTEYGGVIKEEYRNEEGIALCVYNDAGWGKLVREGKYEKRRYSDELIAPCAQAIRKFKKKPDWITWVPSLKREEVVEDFAKRLANALGIPAIRAVRKIKNTQEQKEMQNSSHQFTNVWGAFEVVETHHGTCLLFDDMIDSGWTMAVVGFELRKAGVERVIPFALASATPRAK